MFDGISRVVHILIAQANRCMLSMSIPGHLTTQPFQETSAHQSGKEFREILLLYQSLGNFLNMDFSFGDQFGMIFRRLNGVQ